MILETKTYGFYNIQKVRNFSFTDIWILSTQEADISHL